jgi:hypothetical protein
MSSRPLLIDRDAARYQIEPETKCVSIRGDHLDAVLRHEQVIDTVGIVPAVPSTAHWASVGSMPSSTPAILPMLQATVRICEIASYDSRTLTTL